MGFAVDGSVGAVPESSLATPPRRRRRRGWAAAAWQCSGPREALNYFISNLRGRSKLRVPLVFERESLGISRNYLDFIRILLVRVLQSQFDGGPGGSFSIMVSSSDMCALHIYIYIYIAYQLQTSVCLHLSIHSVVCFNRRF